MVAYMAADIETDGLLKDVTTIHCCCFYNGSYEGIVAVGTQAVISYAQTLVDDGYILVFHNAAYDVPVLRKFGLKIKRGQYMCSMIAQHKIYSGRPSYSLDTLGECIVGMDKLDYAEEMKQAGLWDGSGSVYDIPFNAVMDRYVRRDTSICWALWQDALNHFERDLRMGQNFFDVHMPFTEVIISMQRGLHIDCQELINLSTELIEAHERDLAEFHKSYPTVTKVSWNKEQKMYVIPEPVKQHKPNIASPNDVASLLFTRGWKPVDFDYTTGRPKTNQATFRYMLATLDKEVDASLYNLVSSMQDLKAVGGIKSQLGTLIDHIDYSDWTIKANWRQAGTVTHRLASSSPNLQNISTRHPKWGKRVRAMFTPPEGYAMFVGDFSQAELCILAYYLELVNGDSTMANAARESLDFHNENTKAWFELDEDDNDFSSKRKICKNGIFASNYGAAAKRLALTIGVSIPEALEILHTVDDRTTITDLKERVWDTVEQRRDVLPVSIGHRRVQHGIMYDCLGTRVMYPDIRSNDRYKKSSAKRQVFNALMQTGCFSVLAKCCNNALPYVEAAGGWFAALVHDEAIGYCPLENAAQLQRELNDVFGSFVLATEQGGVPLRAEFTLVNNWSEK